MTLPAAVTSAALDALALHVAVLDADGAVVGANDSWLAFDPRPTAVAPGLPEGENYLRQCAAATDDPPAEEVADDLRSLLAGERSRFEAEYPCHSSAEQSWLALWADRFTVDGEAYAVLAHADVTDRKVAELEMERQKETTEAFASMLNHDLRTPLSVAMGRVELAMEQTGDPNLDPALDSLHRMESMLGEGVAYLRLENEAVERESVSLADAARESWAAVDAPGATFEVTGDRTLRAYPSLLAHLFENLFANAVAFGGDDVTVTVGATADGFFVADDGPGVPPEDRDRVFELGESTRPGSHGFGLAIVETIVDVHGWDVSLTESDAGGARFVVTVEPAQPLPDG